MISEDEQEWATLMSKAQDGDSKAYAILLAAVLPKLRQIVHRRITDSDQGEDVVQDVLLSVHANRHTYDPTRPFRPWLYTIAKFRIADHLRKQYRRKGREELVEEYPETFTAAGTNGYEQGALAYATSDSLKKALSQLPEGQRRAVELLKLKDMSLKEASEVSSMSVPALKVAMHRALKNLKDIFET